MKKVIRIFRSHEAAEKSDREFYKRLSSQERLDMLLTLIARNQEAIPDATRTGLKRVYRVLNNNEVRYLVVGAHAVAFHGRPRYTADIDFFVDSSPENAERITKALDQFGLGDIGVDSADFTVADLVVQLGVEPNRVDIMTSISGVSFEEAWDTRADGELDGLPVQFISKDLLKRNKASVGRKQDLADLDYL
ncbi:MAG TPA: hypothetical protein VJV03_03535 [Pyrinomonadaceae bacterium]|nr:hypothetical protein [Pyrinomonadaceae bacterium]